MELSKPSNVTEFPDRASRSWRWISEELRKMYRQSGWGDDLIEQMIATLAPIYARNRDEHHIPKSLSPDDAVLNLNKWVSGVVIGLLVEIANRELALLAHGRAPSAA